MRVRGEGAAREGGEVGERSEFEKSERASFFFLSLDAVSTSTSDFFFPFVFPSRLRSPSNAFERRLRDRKSSIRDPPLAVSGLRGLAGTKQEPACDESPERETKTQSLSTSTFFFPPAFFWFSFFAFTHELNSRLVASRRVSTKNNRRTLSHCLRPKKWKQKDNFSPSLTVFQERHSKIKNPEKEGFFFLFFPVVLPPLSHQTPSKI